MIISEGTPRHVVLTAILIIFPIRSRVGLVRSFPVVLRPEHTRLTLQNLRGVVLVED